MRRVVVTGIGAVTPLGVGAKQSWTRLINGQSGIVSLGDRFNAIPSRVAGLVPQGAKSDGKWNAEERLDKGDARKMALFAQYAYTAAQEAVLDAGLQNLSDEARENVGVNIGSGIGSFEDVVKTTLAFDQGGYSKVSPLFVPRLLINLAAGHISMKFNFRGPSLAPSTACTTGSHAIGDAFNIIRYSKSTRVVLAGAAESCIEPLALAGFARARSLSTGFNDIPEEASRPFDRGRDGFVIAEGAGVVVLEDLEHALERGAPEIYAEVVGYGLASDAYHVTAPDPSGRGAFLSMKRALEDAELRPRDVDYVNAHATSTPLGDSAENRAIRNLMLGEGGYEHAQQVNVSSSKGAVGHLLGAAGGVEGIFTALAVRHNILPPTINLQCPGPALKEKDDNLDGWDLNYVPFEKQEQQVNYAVSNSFGFGGTCASICFKKYTE
ncbi:3-oxoacyl-synthase 2 [Microthyrium microscopicum]|uniref:3-oxoacyl-[acyl-carrier-protein] synthase n=1 Tax=Microthyrium microscopicum TaxID=703497 RepID=A0A6A6UVP3_9PEZI|nr:3-oxoacyl-synthase 2 [Microthyrium microscopicum]